MDPTILKYWCVALVVFLTILGIVDASYQYFYNDQYRGGKRTAGTIFIICIMLLLLIKCPWIVEPDPEPLTTRWLNPFTLAAIGTFCGMVSILLACIGRRSKRVWAVLAFDRYNRQMPYRIPAK